MFQKTIKWLILRSEKPKHADISVEGPDLETFISARFFFTLSNTSVRTLSTATVNANSPGRRQRVAGTGADGEAYRARQAASGRTRGCSGKAGDGREKAPVISKKEMNHSVTNCHDLNRRGAQRFSKGRGERLGFTKVFSKAHNKTDVFIEGAGNVS